MSVTSGAAVSTAGLLVLFPVGAAAVGAGVAAWRRPGPQVTSGIQHFAAGVVFAALAGEVLPDLRREGHLGAVLLGFSAGVGLLLALAGDADGWRWVFYVNIPIGIGALVAAVRLLRIE